MPGLAVTTGLTELAAGHLVAGATRLAAGAVVLAMLGLGVALGVWATALLPGLGQVGAAPLPDWVSWAALPATAVGLVVLLRAHPRDTLFIVVAGRGPLVAGSLARPCSVPAWAGWWALVWSACTPTRSPA